MTVDSAALAVGGRVEVGAPDFDQIVRRYQRQVLSLAFDLTGNYHDAEDLTQETFVRAYAGLRRFRGDADLGTWLHRITVNAYIDRYRSRAEKVGRAQASWDDPESSLPAPREQRPAANPERRAESAVIQRHIDTALERLPPQQRTVFVLRHYQGLKLREIAALLEVSEGTVKATLSRGVRRLQEALSFYRPDQPIAVRTAALRVIGDRGDPAWVAFLAEVASTTNDTAIGRAAVGALEDIGGSEVIEALEEISRSSSLPGVRREALNELGEVGGDSAVSRLEGVATGASDAASQRAALDALGEIGSPAALEALTRVASDHADPTVRRLAVRAMEEFGGDEVGPHLGRVLREDPDSQVRRQAARTLGEVGGAAAVGALRDAALDTSRPDVQRAAVDALGEIGTPAARDVWLELLGR